MDRKAFTNDTTAFSSASAALAFIVALIVAKAMPGTFTEIELSGGTAALTALFAAVGRQIKYYAVERGKNG